MLSITAKFESNNNYTNEITMCGDLYNYLARNEAAQPKVDVFRVSHTKQWKTGLNCTENINMACKSMISPFRLTTRQFCFHLKNHSCRLNIRTNCHTMLGPQSFKKFQYNKQLKNLLQLQSVSFTKNSNLLEQKTMPNNYLLQKTIIHKKNEKMWPQ